MASPSNAHNSSSVLNSLNGLNPSFSSSNSLFPSNGAAFQLNTPSFSSNVVTSNVYPSPKAFETGSHSGNSLFSVGNCLNSGKDDNQYIGFMHVNSSSSSNYGSGTNSANCTYTFSPGTKKRNEANFISEHPLKKFKLTSYPEGFSSSASATSSPENGDRGGFQGTDRSFQGITRQRSMKVVESNSLEKTGNVNSVVTNLGNVNESFKLSLGSIGDGNIVSDGHMGNCNVSSKSNEIVKLPSESKRMSDEEDTDINGTSTQSEDVAMGGASLPVPFSIEAKREELRQRYNAELQKYRQQMNVHQHGMAVRSCPGFY